MSFCLKIKTTEKAGDTVLWWGVKYFTRIWVQWQNKRPKRGARKVNKEVLFSLESRCNFYRLWIFLSFLVRKVRSFWQSKVMTTGALPRTVFWNVQGSSPQGQIGPQVVACWPTSVGLLPALRVEFSGKSYKTRISQGSRASLFTGK